MYSVLLTTVVSFTFCLLLTPLVRGLAFRWNLVDRPDGERKLHRRAVPRVGGIPILFSYAVTYVVLLLSPLKAGDVIEGELPLVWALLSAAAAVFLIGLVDDVRGITPGLKISGQVVAALLAHWGGVHIASIAAFAVPEWLCFPLTLVWLVGCSNAFNLIDGVDGLATGVGLLTTLTIFAAALLEHNTPLALATAPLAGCLLGFLRYNFNPASIFLGDSGSLSIGFLLGCYGVIWSQKSATILGMTAPLMALAVPLLDTAVAILRRFLRGRPIFNADRGHMHHRLLDRGHTPRRVALLLYAACGFAALFSLLTTVINPSYAGVVLVAFLGAAWLGIHQLGYAEFSAARQAVFGGDLQGLVNCRISLARLEQAIACSENSAACWAALRDGCEDLGISHVGLRLRGKDYQSPAMKGPVRPSWYAYVPLSGSDHVLLGPAAGSEVSASVLGPLVTLLGNSLRGRLAEFSLGDSASGDSEERTDSLLQLSRAIDDYQGSSPRESSVVTGHQRAEKVT